MLKKIIKLLTFLIITTHVGTSYAQTAEQYVEMRAAKACAGWGNSTDKSQGNVTVDNLSIKGDGKGTITVSRDGVDLGHFSSGTFDQYQKCLIEVIRLISPSKNGFNQDKASVADYSDANKILSDMLVDVKMGSVYNGKGDLPITIVKPDTSKIYTALQKGLPGLKQIVAAAQIFSGGKEVEPGVESSFDGYVFLDSKSGIVIAIYLSDNGDEKDFRGGGILIDTWKDKFGYDMQNYYEVSREEIPNSNGWSRIARMVRSFNIDLGSSVMWWDGRADIEVRVCGGNDPACSPKWIEGKPWGQSVWIINKDLVSASR